MYRRLMHREVQLRELCGALGACPTVSEAFGRPIGPDEAVRLALSNAQYRADELRVLRVQVDACDAVSRGAYADVRAERERQDAKWGEQNHPMVPRKGVDGFGYDPGPRRVAEHYAFPMAGRARFMVNEAGKRGGLTYCGILLEEFAEAVEAAVLHGDTSDEFRAEMVQTAAVAVAMIEAVDRARAKAEGGAS